DPRLRNRLPDQPGAEAAPHADLEDDVGAHLAQEPEEGEGADAAKAVEVAEGGPLQQRRKIVQRVEQSIALFQPRLAGFDPHRVQTRGRAGGETTVVPAATSATTTAPIPMTAPRPMRSGRSGEPLRITAPEPTKTSSPISTHPLHETRGA